MNPYVYIKTGVKFDYKMRPMGNGSSGRIFYKEISLKNFDISIFWGKVIVLVTKGAVECFRERFLGRGEVISLEADKARTRYRAKKIL